MSYLGMETDEATPTVNRDTGEGAEDCYVGQFVFVLRPFLFLFSTHSSLRKLPDSDCLLGDVLLQRNSRDKRDMHVAACLNRDSAAGTSVCH